MNELLETEEKFDIELLAALITDAYASGDRRKIAEEAVRAKAILWRDADKAIDQEREYQSQWNLLTTAVLIRVGTRYPVKKGGGSMTDEELQKLSEECAKSCLNFFSARTKEEFEKADYDTQVITEKAVGLTPEENERVWIWTMEKLETNPNVSYWMIREIKKHFEQGKVLANLLGIQKEPSYPDEKLRKQLAKEIVEEIRPQLEKDIAKAVEDSLVWRKTKMLKKLKKAVKEERKPVKVTGRESCIFLEVGNEVIMLG